MKLPFLFTPPEQRVPFEEHLDRIVKNAKRISAISSEIQVKRSTSTILGLHQKGLSSIMRAALSGSYVKTLHLEIDNSLMGGVNTYRLDGERGVKLSHSDVEDLGRGQDIETFDLEMSVPAAIKVGKLVLGTTDVKKSMVHVIGQLLASQIVNLSQVVYFALQRERMEVAVGGVESFGASQKTWGTSLADGLSYMARAFRSDGSCLCAVRGHIARVSYTVGQSVSKRGHVAGGREVSLDEALAAALSRDSWFHWIDVAAARTLFPQIDERSFESVLFIPFGEGSEVFAFAAFVYTNENIWAHQHLDHRAIQRLREALHKCCTYLNQRSFSQLIVNPIYKSRDTRIQEKRCAVLMPFGERWSNRIYAKIRDSVNSTGASAHRADDLYGTDVMEDIWTMILQSEFVIADITGRNPNVFYELGIAHTLGKQVILLTQEVSDIPFDLNRYRHIIYEDNGDGYEILNAGIVNAMQSQLTGGGAE